MCHHVFIYDGRDNSNNSQANGSIKYIPKQNAHGGVMLAHGVDPISRVAFIPHLRHLSFRKKRLTSCALVQL